MTTTDYPFGEDLSYVTPVAPGLYLLRDGRLMAALRYEPISPAPLGDDDLRHQWSRLHAFAMRLPHKVEVQWITLRDYHAPLLLPAPPDDAHPNVRRLWHEAFRFYRAVAPTTLQTTALAVLTYAPPTVRQSLFTQLFRSHPERCQDDRARELATDVAQLRRHVERLHGLLAELRTFPRVCSTDALSAILFQLLNPGLWRRRRPPRIRPGDYAADRLSLTDADYSDPRFIDLGGTKVALVNLKTFPPVARPGMLAPLLELSFPLMVHAGIRRPPEGRIKFQIELKSRITAALRPKKHEQGATSSEIGNQIVSDDATAALEQVLRGDAAWQTLVFTAATWAADLPTLIRQRDDLLARLADLEAEALPLDQGNHWSYLRASLPGHAHRAPRARLNLSDAITALTPLWADGTQTGRAGAPVPFHTRTGGLYRLALYDPALANPHMLVFGGSGQGKTFTVSQVLLHTLMSDAATPHIIWVDIGGISPFLLGLLDAEVVDVSLSGLSSFDPFAGLTGPELTDDQQLFLASLFERLVLAGSTAATLEAFEKQYLLDAAKVVVAHHRRFDLSLYDAALENAGDGDLARKFRARLRPWLPGQGIYGNVFSGAAERRAPGVRKRFTYFNLQGVAQNPDLLAVAPLLTYQHILDTCYRLPGPKIINWDELWYIASYPQSAALLEQNWRSGRYTGTAVIGSTQAQEEVKGLAGLFPNTPRLIFLRHEATEVEHLRTVLALNKREVELILGLERGELYLKAPSYRGVLRLRVPGTQYWAATTHGPERERLARVYERLGDYWEAIAELARSEDRVSRPNRSRAA